MKIGLALLVTIIFFALPVSGSHDATHFENLYQMVPELDENAGLGNKWNVAGQSPCDLDIDESWRCVSESRGNLDFHDGHNTFVYATDPGLSAWYRFSNVSLEPNTQITSVVFRIVAFYGEPRTVSQIVVSPLVLLTETPPSRAQCFPVPRYNITWEPPGSQFTTIETPPIGNCSSGIGALDTEAKLNDLQILVVGSNEIWNATVSITMIEALITTQRFTVPISPIGWFPEIPRLLFLAVIGSAIAISIVFLISFLRAMRES